MQTNFTAQQLADAATAESDKILRNCVHCGFCTATCPTFVLLGDELDSPRGRIYLIKEMLESDEVPSRRVVTHIDRCLSCLSCMTTCPSGVHYMHLIDHARAHIERTYRRPLGDRLLRGLLARVIPDARLFRLSLIGAKLARPIAGLLPGRLKGLMGMAPKHIAPPSWVDRPQVIPAKGPRKKRVALMTGCAQKALNPAINEATVNLLSRLGVEVVVAQGSGCCGALTHHMGKEDQSHAQAIDNIKAWMRERDGDGLDAVIINASGCGTTVKDYGHMLRDDPAWAQPAAQIAALAQDITEFLATLDLPEATAAEHRGLKVAYHSACSMQHGQKITTAPKTLLTQTGFEVLTPAESHLCCGSAGTYNITQPELATQLRDRKVANIEKTQPDLIASGNIGCMVQIQGGTQTPVVHTVELLDWALGGEKPAALAP